MAILRRQLKATQWGALVILLAGVAMVQLAQTEPAKTVSDGPEQNRMIGFSAALAACFLSGFAGIYFEKILKVSMIYITFHVYLNQHFDST